MTFKSEIEGDPQYKINLVIKIEFGGNSYYFSKFQVDSGLVVPTENVGIVDGVSTQPAQVDLRTVKTSVPATTIKIVDVDHVFTKFMGTDDSSLISRKITVYVGFITGSFDFSEYIVQSVYFIDKFSQQGDEFSLNCRGTTSEISKRTFSTQGNLQTGMNDTQTTASVTTGQDIFPATGTLKIKDEFVQYTGKSFSSGITTFTPISRADLNSEAVAHAIGDEVFFVERIEDRNPIDILLQVLTSTGNGTNGVYDVLTDGIGIDASEILISKFEQIRDDFFVADLFTLYLYDIENTIKYLEKEIFQANNVRLTEEIGIMSLAVLDQSLPGADLPVVDDTVLDKKPAKYTLSKKEIVNSFDVKYFWIEGTKQYARTKPFEDAVSIALYGLRKGKTLEFKGVQSDAIAQDRGNRFLNRFKTPFGKISVSQFLSTYSTPAGDKVNFFDPDVVYAGKRGLNGELEKLKQGINWATGDVKSDYVFTSFFNVRRGLIAPCKPIIEVISANTLRIGAGLGKFYKAGFTTVLYDIVGAANLADPTNTITEVITDGAGDILVFADNWISAAVTTVALRFAPYPEASEKQQAQFAYAGQPLGADFADGTTPYKIF